MRSEFESRETFECIFGGEDGIDLSKDETGEYSFQPSRFAYSFFLVAWQYRQTDVDELQKRVDAVTNVLKSIRKEIEHGHLSDDESQTLSSYANDLEQALKGEQP